MKVRAFLAFIPSTLLLSCGGGEVVEDGGGLTVVASILPIYLLTENVVGNTTGVTVDVLVSPEAGDIHNYQLVPGDLLKLNRADLVILNGLGLEGFLGDALADLPEGTEIVTAGEGIEPLPLTFHNHQGEPHGDEHGEWDPHLWVSPRNAVRMTQNIRDALAEADPAHADAYRANAAEFIARLEALYEKMLTAARGWPNRAIVTNHDAFGYLARDLDLEIAGVVMLTPGASPSAGEMLRLVGMIRNKGAAAVFVEPGYPEGSARNIARDAEVPVYVLDPCTTGGTDPGRFLEVMEKNLENLDAALGGR
ncbi:MAG TPA: metal ABC transporter substrate-binding protein [bacterium]|nr:metal ABC transporter substrate-binding protein [bacterium]